MNFNSFFQKYRNKILLYSFISGALSIFAIYVLSYFMSILATQFQFKNNDYLIFVFRVIVLGFLAYLNINKIIKYFKEFCDHNSIFNVRSYIKTHLKNYNIISITNLLYMEEYTSKFNIKEVWVIASDLKMETEDEKLMSIIKKNIKSNIPYTFFVPKMSEEDKDTFRKIYTKNTRKLKIVDLSPDYKRYLFEDFDVVLHNPSIKYTNKTDENSKISGFMCIAPEKGLTAYKTISKDKCIDFRDVLLEVMNEK